MDSLGLRPVENAFLHEIVLRKEKQSDEQAK